MTLHYTPEQERALLELRNRMAHELPPNIYNDDVFLYKFLTARDFNLKKSEIMLRNHLRFRKEIQVDTLMDFESPEVLRKFLTMTFLGFDKEGHPLRYLALGNVDALGLTKSVNDFYTVKHMLRFVEADKKMHVEQSKKLGKPIYRSVFIFDLDKLPFVQATSKAVLTMFLKVVGVFQDNYPEMVKKVFAINASMYFALAWPVIKTFMAPNLLEKIHVYWQSDFKDDLLTYIDADVLPGFLGGNRTDPDGNPMCYTFVERGGKIPEKYYFVKNLVETALKPGMKHIRLGRQEKISVSILIQKPTSILKWEFELKCQDIGFGLIRVASSDGKAEEVIPIHKQDTENGPMCGMYRCDKVGKYVIVFDNSYSWIYQKDIYYRAWVTDSCEIE